MKIAFLVVSPETLSQEERSALSFLSLQRGYHGRILRFSSIERNPDILRGYDLTWWHFDESTTIPDIACRPNVIQSIKSFVSEGRGLLLSLLATQYVFELGVESVRPNIRVAGEWTERSWAEGYPDIRGFGGFGQHPIFRGVAGGPYTWSPATGEKYCASYYEDHVPVAGKVVAVEKAYIRLNERRRLITEHEIGKGRLLSVGAYFYFADTKTRFRKHLELFSSNCFSYLTAKPRQRAISPGRIMRMHWSFDTPRVTKFAHTSKAISPGSQKLQKSSGDLVLRRDFSSPELTEQFFDLSGRRVLVMGGERGGITEVWCHPVRILENVKVQFKVGNSPSRWSHELTPVVTIQPESLVRRYTLDQAVIEETIFADLDHPSGTIHYRVTSDEVVQVVVTARIDLRRMWPVSERATGSLRYAWDKGLRAGIVTDNEGELSSVLGSSIQPTEWLMGQFSGVELENGHLQGRQSDETVVAVGLCVSLSRGSSRFTIAFAGSGQGLKESLLAYRKIIRRPGSSLRRQASRFRKLLQSSTRISTPDEQLNNSYRWSLAGLEKLFSETPLLGSSFMAGFGLSSSGWNGGHSISGRPGYAWYFGRDSVWAGLAALAAGQYDKVRGVLEFLGDHQGTDGKILHEMTTSGYAHFDAADSTPLYLVLMGRYVKSSGDRRFAARAFPNVLKAIDYCFSTDTDCDHLIENTHVGHGWVEGGQLFPSHAEHYLASCWAAALEESAQVAELLKENRLAKRWRLESEAVCRILKDDFWNPATKFYNFSRQSDGTYREDQTILPAVGMYFGCADAKNAQYSLDEYAGSNFSADWGVRIVGRSDRLFNPTGYHYGSIWPLFTGWTALAEFSLRRPAQGMMHALSNIVLFDQFSGGNTEEVLHGELFQPAGVCPHQAWSQSMVIQPLLEGMLGIESDALKGVLTLSPYLPPHWKEAEVRNIRVGNDRIDLRVKRMEKETVYTASLCSAPSGGRPRRRILLRITPFFPLGTRILDVKVGGEKIHSGLIIDDFRKLPVLNTRLDGKTVVRVRHSEGLAVIPPTPNVRHGQKSGGIRILRESWRDNSYVLTLEGIPGEDYMLDVIDRACRAKSVDGARVMAHDGEHLILAVPFTPDATGGAYSRKEIVINT